MISQLQSFDSYIDSLNQVEVVIVSELPGATGADRGVKPEYLRAERHNLIRDDDRMLVLGAVDVHDVDARRTIV